MSAQLPPTERMLLRSLKRTAIVLLLIFRLDPQPVGRDDVADLLDIDTKTSAKYLHDLSQHGLITRTGYRDGYVLTVGGRQMVLGMEAKKLHGESGNFPLSENPALLESGNSPLSKIPALPEGGIFPLSDVHASPKVEIFHLESGIFPPSETLVVEDIKSTKILDESTRLAQSGNSPLSLAQVLEIAPLLFDGHVVSIHGIEDADPQDALRWIAYSYRNREKLERPCGLIYRRLQKHTAPPNSAEIDKLPRSILSRLGLAAPTAQNDDQPDEEETEELVETPAPCPALDERRNGGETASPREAWQQALKELQPEMARASFETWVRDTAPIVWSENQSEAVLHVATRNLYGKNWLESRFTELVSPLLCSILNLTVHVRFVVARVSTETEE